MFLFLSLYGSLHLYLFFKIKALFLFGPKGAFGLSLFLLFMIFSPIFAFRLEREQLHFARPFAMFAFSWMGFAFLTFFYSVLSDFFYLFFRLFAFPSNSRSFVYIPFILSLLSILYGFFEAESIVVKRLEIGTEKMPLSENLKVLHITDLHLGLTTRKRQVEKIFNVLKKEEVDLILSTGDIVDGDMERYLPYFLQLNPRIGKFTVTGNHEFYRGIDRSAEFLERAGFRVLRNESVKVANLVNIVGFDDSGFLPYGKEERIHEKKILEGLDRNLFTIVLKHRPIVEEDSLGLFDLQISGHTHGGQIFPFRLLTKLFFRKVTGFFSLPRGSFLYVSSGAGTWGPPIRFLSPPEITILNIEGKKAVHAKRK